MQTYGDTHGGNVCAGTGTLDDEWSRRVSTPGWSVSDFTSTLLQTDYRGITTISTGTYRAVVNEMMLSEPLRAVAKA